MKMNQVQLGEKGIGEDLYESVPVYQIELLLFSKPYVERDLEQLGRTDTGEERHEPKVWGDFGEGRRGSRRRWSGGELIEGELMDADSAEADVEGQIYFSDGIWEYNS